MRIRKLPRRGVHRAPATLRGLVRGALSGEAALATFQREAAAVFRVPHAVATGSGRRALTAILGALPLSPGDTVLLPALTFHAVPTAVAAAGLRPRFGDVDPETCLLTASAVDDAPDARLVLATHLFGLVCDLDGLRDRCAAREAWLVEDFAQAAGARWRGRPVGSWGDAGFTSLETVKPLAAFGGGLVTTRDAGLARRVEASERALPSPVRRKLVSKVALGQLEAALADPRVFSLAWPLFSGGADDQRSEGWIQRYKSRKQGVGNHGARLHPSQAEVGRRGLVHLPEHLAARRARADELRGLLGGHATPRV
ncbi:MAG: DegT/DnrJ/EryC1/StrS family aminotransferase, partial [Myxococcota bacterium]|nr:DegT/DnrJ/EryC1/StrS family aminotransferase [Myxococcota bacterium]